MNQRGDATLGLVLLIVIVLICAVIGYQIAEEVSVKEWAHWLGALLGLLVGLVLGREVAART